MGCLATTTPYEYHYNVYFSFFVLQDTVYRRFTSKAASKVEEQDMKTKFYSFIHL